MRWDTKNGRQGKRERHKIMNDADPAAPLPIPLPEGGFFKHPSVAVVCGGSGESESNTGVVGVVRKWGPLCKSAKMQQARLALEMLGYVVCSGLDVLTPLAQSVTADACSDTCPVAARRQLIHFAVEYLFQDTLFQDTFVNLKFNSDDDAKQYLATCIDRQTTCIDSFNKAKLLFESSSQKCDYSAIQDTIGALGFVLQCQCSKEAMDQVLESLYSGPLGFDMADFELAFGKRDNALLLNAR